MSQQRPKGIRSNIRLVLDEEGHYCYPPTQRKDGTWRKPIRVRPGHEESEQIYVIKQRREPSEDSETVVDGTSEDDMRKHDEDEESVASARSLNDSGLGDNQKEESSKKKGGGFSLPSLELYLMHLAPELSKTSPSSEVETKSTTGGSTSTNTALGSVTSKEVKKEMEGQENDEHKELPVKNVVIEEESMSPNSKVNTWLKNGRYEEPNATAEECIQAFIQRMDSLGPEEQVAEWNALVGNWLLNA